MPRPGPIHRTDAALLLAMAAGSACGLLGAGAAWAGSRTASPGLRSLLPAWRCGQERPVGLTEGIQAFSFSLVWIWCLSGGFLLF